MLKAGCPACAGLKRALAWMRAANGGGGTGGGGAKLQNLIPLQPTTINCAGVVGGPGINGAKVHKLTPALTHSVFNACNIEPPAAAAVATLLPYFRR